MDVAQALRAPGVGLRDLRKALAEGALAAVWVPASKAVQPDPQADGSSLRGQIGEPPPVATADAGRGELAGGTARGCRLGRGQDDDVLGSGRDRGDVRPSGHEER